MPTLRLLLHVALAGVYVFLTSLTLLVQLASSNVTVTGLGVLTLVGAWAGASSTLRTKESLLAAAGAIAALLALTLRGPWFNFYLTWWIAYAMVPLASTLWLLVAWRRFSDDEEDQTLPATH
jgi:hypothetical protein